MNLPNVIRSRGASLLALALLGALLALIAILAPSLRPDRDDRLHAEAGAEIYRQHCASCHGIDLEGQPRWRERLPNGRLPAPPHDRSGHTWHHSDKQLFETTKNGVSAIVPGDQSDMPPFKDVLSDEQISAVIGFIKSTWPSEIRNRQERMNRDG